MKYLRWLLPLPVAAFPYVSFVLLYGGMETASFWTAMGVIWLVCAACAVTAALLRRLWTPQALAAWAMAAKLIHIPAYVLWFFFALATLPFGGPVIAFVFDLMAILLSGALGLAAVASNRQAEKLTAARAAVHGVLQFVFCADVVSAVLVYRASRKEKKEEVKS